MTAKSHPGFENRGAILTIPSYANFSLNRSICVDARFFVGLPYVH
jgi:hypothetical protein